VHQLPSNLGDAPKLHAATGWHEARSTRWLTNIWRHGTKFILSGCCRPGFVSRVDMGKGKLENCLFNVVVSSAYCIWASKKWRCTRSEVRGSYSSVTEDAGRDVTDVSVNRWTSIFRIILAFLTQKMEALPVLKNLGTVYAEQPTPRKYISLIYFNIFH